MNKKFLSAILFGALMVTSTGTFVSCKDYDDDIDSLQGQISANASAIAELQKLVGNGDYVTSISVSGQNLVVNTKNGSTNVPLPKCEDKVGSMCTISEEGELLIDGKATGIKVAEQAEDAEFKPAIDIVDGEWAVLQEDNTYKSTGVAVSSVAVTGSEQDGYVLTIKDAEGTATVIELPTAASMISELEFIGWLDAAGNFTEFSPAATANNKYDMSYAAYYTASKVEWAWKDADESQKYENSIAAKTAITMLEGASLVVRVAPATVDAADIDFSLVNSKMAEAPIALGTAKAYTGLITRAASENGLYAIPLSGVAASDVAANYIAKKFYVDGDPNKKQIAYALKASKFVSDFNLTFGSDDLTATAVKLNNVAITIPSTNIATYSVAVDQNKANTFTFTVPTSIYDSKIIVDEVIAQNWGVTVSGNSFTVSNFYDKATIDGFPIYFYYYDLQKNKEVKVTVTVRLKRNLVGVTTLDAKAHTINKAADKDNFSASIKPMYEGMTTEQLNNWKEYVNSTSMKIYQVGAAADGSDAEIENTYYNSIALLDKDGGAMTVDKLKKGELVTVKVDLSQKWPGTASVTSTGKYSLDGEYYVLVKFEDSNSDVLSTVKLPFTLSVPTFNDIFVHQDGIWVNEVAQAYMYATDVRGPQATPATATYTIKNAFKTLKDNMGAAFTFDWTLDGADANKIGGYKHSALASLSATSITNANVETATITLTNDLNADGTADLNDNGTQKGYGQELIINVKNAKYLGKFVYGTADDVDYTFKLKIMSPLFEGKVYAVDNAVKLDATSLEEQKVNDSHIKAHTYNTTQVYSIFSDKIAPDYWTRPELKSVVFESGNAELFSVTASGTTYEPAVGNPGDANYVAAKYGYAGVKINQNANISVETTSTIKVTVEDAWGYKLTQEVPVVLQVTK